MKTKIKQAYGYVLDTEGKVISKFADFPTDVEHEFPDGVVVVDDCTKRQWNKIKIHTEPIIVSGTEARLYSTDGYGEKVQIGDVVDEILKAVYSGEDLSKNKNLIALSKAQMAVKSKYDKNKNYQPNSDGTFSEVK